MRTRMFALFSSFVFLLVASLPALAQSRPVYQKPPKVIADVLESAPTPLVYIAPTHDRLIEAQGVRHPRIADLAAPMLRLAGLRINPATNGMYQALKGNGATVRYVTLPFETDGYIALESVEDVQWEMVNWFDKYVKNAGESSASGK